MKGLDKVMGMADEWLDKVMKVENERSNKVMEVEDERSKKVMRKCANEGMEEIQINKDLIIIMIMK